MKTTLSIFRALGTSRGKNIARHPCNQSEKQTNAIDFRRHRAVFQSVKICQSFQKSAFDPSESGGDISQAFASGGTLRRAPPRPRLVASGRTRLVSRSCTRATLFPSSRPATRHARPLAEKAELVKSMMAASARGVACPAQPRVARLSSRRATAVAPAAAPTRARRARSNTVEGTRGDGGSPASPPLARSPQALFKPPPSATVRDRQTVRGFFSLLCAVVFFARRRFESALDSPHD